MTPLKSLVRLEHVGGAHKDVELVGFTAYAAGEAMLYWPGAGHYTVRLREGAILELRTRDDTQAQWRVPPAVLCELRSSYDAWRREHRACRRMAGAQ